MLDDESFDEADGVIDAGRQKVVVVLLWLLERWQSDEKAESSGSQKVVCDEEKLESGRRGENL